MKMLIRVVAAALLAASAVAQQPKAVITPPDFNFGKLVQGAAVEHTFVVRNEGEAALDITNVSMSRPIRLVGVRAHIDPGEEGAVKVALETSNLSGEYDGRILLTLNDPAMPEAELRLVGTVVRPLELSPSSALFLVAPRGSTASRSVELISHEAAPLTILGLEYPRERLSATLETLEPGRRFRVTVGLNPAAPAGRQRQEVLLRTSSATLPRLGITVFSYLHERVYTFPDAVDLGTLRLRDVIDDPALLQKSAQTLMVYQTGGTDFRVNVRSDVPGLDLVAERGSKGDRFQITATLQRAAVTPRKIEGNIIIETSDAEFPRLVVPVSGEIIR